MISICFVTDNKTGHRKQLEALECAFKEQVPIATSWIDINTDQQPSSESTFDIVIGAGHSTHKAVLSLAKQYQALSCSVMSPSLPHGLFDAIIAPRHDKLKNSKRVLTTKGPLIKKSAIASDTRSEGLILLGGQSKHFIWDEEKIIKQITTISQDDSLPWSVSCSRRTPVSTAQAIQQQLSHIKIIEATADIEPILASAKSIWVSPDSINMMYEALNTQEPVGVLQLKSKRRILRRNKVLNELKTLEQENLIFRYIEDKAPAPSHNSKHQSSHAPSSEAQSAIINEAERAVHWLLKKVEQRKAAPHVAQILPALHGGGVERGTIELAEHLSSNHIKSSVISSGGKLTKELNLFNVRHHTLPVHSKNPVRIILNAFAMVRLIKEHGINLLHVRSRAPAWSTLLASKLSGVPYVATFHGVYGHQPAAKRFYNSAMLRGVRTIAVSQFVERHIQSTYPALANHIVTINRGVDTHFFKPAQEQSQPKEKEVFTLLMPARFTRLKGHAFVLKALEQFNNTRVELIFIGDKTGKDDYYKEIQKLSESSCHTVRFVEHQKNLQPFYENADVVLSATTKPESFGRTIIEAQAMKTFVLAPDHGTSRDIIAPELIPYALYKAQNESSFIAALQKIYTLSTDKRSLVGDNAHAFVQTHFEKSQTTQKTLQLYKELWQKSAMVSKL